MRATLLTIILASLGLNVHAADKAAKAAGDLGLLQGRWTAMAGARRHIRVVIEVKGRGVNVTITTPEGPDFQVEGELKLDERSSPRSLTWCNFIGPGEQPLPDIAAVYKVEGDTFTVCNGGFHGARPKEIKPGESALADLVVFRRLGTHDSVTQVHVPSVSAPRTPRKPDQATTTPQTHENRSAEDRSRAKPSTR
jgi:uncharacterized protein (TIGR03067 family)